MKLTSQLNPYSATFQPFASPPRTMPDISQLSFSDKASTVSDEFKVVSYLLTRDRPVLVSCGRS